MRANIRPTLAWFSLFDQGRSRKKTRKGSTQKKCDERKGERSGNGRGREPISIYRKDFPPAKVDREEVGGLGGTKKSQGGRGRIGRERFKGNERGESHSKCAHNGFPTRGIPPGGLEGNPRYVD